MVTGIRVVALGLQETQYVMHLSVDWEAQQALATATLAVMKASLVLQDIIVIKNSKTRVLAMRVPACRHHLLLYLHLAKEYNVVLKVIRMVVFHRKLHVIHVQVLGGHVHIKAFVLHLHPLAW